MAPRTAGEATAVAALEDTVNFLTTEAFPASHHSENEALRSMRYKGRGDHANHVSRADADDDGPSLPLILARMRAYSG